MDGRPSQRLSRLRQRIQIGLQRRIDKRRPDPFLTVGPHTYPQHPTIDRYKGDGEAVTISASCSISGGVEILPGGNHNPHWVSTFPFRYRFGMSGAFGDGLPSSRGPVQIGNDDGAVIGARAVVTRDVRPYVIVVGDPATEVRRRFDDDTVTRLLETAWWAWPDCVVRAATPLLSSDDLTAFFDFAANRQHPSRPTPTATQPSA